MYTWLQHTHAAVPHYGTSEFTFLRGALATIDRPYPFIIDHLHHHIGTTHVAHHINYSVPHYKAKLFTNELKLILGKYYNFDSTGIYQSLVKTARKCHYVNDVTAIQLYKQHSNSK